MAKRRKGDERQLELFEEIAAEVPDESRSPRRGRDMATGRRKAAPRKPGQQEHGPATSPSGEMPEAAGSPASRTRRHTPDRLSSPAAAAKPRKS